MFNKLLKRLILSRWFKDYTYEGLKPALDLTKLSDKNLQDYSLQAKTLRDNLAYKDIRKLLIHKYEHEIITGKRGWDALDCKRYLKIIDELNLLVESGCGAYEMRKLSKGVTKKYR